jgi:hypothetical protein
MICWYKYFYWAAFLNLCVGLAFASASNSLRGGLSNFILALVLVAAAGFKGAYDKHE